MKTGSLFWVIILVSCSTQIIKKNERYYQEKWCLARGGQMEVVMPDKTRCDCLIEDYAIEFDFAPKWSEAIGQSLNYARQTGKLPGIVLICRSKNDLKKISSVKNNSNFYKLKIKIWTINCGERI